MQDALTGPGKPPELAGRPKTIAAEELDLQTEDYVIDLSGIAAAPVLALVSNDLDWIYPDDPRVWRHFAKCAEQNAYAAFIVRKLSIATFPLFRALSAIGIQLHQLVTRDEEAVTAAVLADALTWPPVITMTSARTHKALETLRSQYKQKSRTFHLQVARDRLEVAAELGLFTSNSGPTAVLHWHKRSNVEMPSKWLTEMQRWSTWEANGLLWPPQTTKST